MVSIDLLATATTHTYPASHSAPGQVKRAYESQTPVGCFYASTAASCGQPAQAGCTRHGGNHTHTGADSGKRRGGRASSVWCGERHLLSSPKAKKKKEKKKKKGNKTWLAADLLDNWNAAVSPPFTPSIHASRPRQLHC